MRRILFLIACLMSMSSVSQQLQQTIFFNNGNSTVDIPINSLQSMSFDSINVIFHKVSAPDESFIRAQIDSVVIEMLPPEPLPHSCGEPGIHNPNINYGTVMDVDGNTYKTVTIGNQEWMAENLMVTAFNNGDEIPVRSYYPDIDCSFHYSRSEEWPNFVGEVFSAGRDVIQVCNSSDYLLGELPPCPYGYVYSGYTIEDTRGICPIGWHIPSLFEFQELSNVLGGGEIAGAALTSAYGWDTLPPAASYNTSGFSALPGGNRWSAYSTIEVDFIVSDGGTGFLTSFWGRSNSSMALSNQTNQSIGQLPLLTITSGVGSPGSPAGKYVRCLKDLPNQLEGCTNSSACNYNSLANYDDASCVYPGEACNDDNPLTLYDVIGIDCECAGVMGIVGDQHTCGMSGVHNPNIGYGSMTDQEGNTYRTITIGQQEWMAENLNTTIYSNGDTIPGGLPDSLPISTVLTPTPPYYEPVGFWTYYNNDSSFACPYGKLYTEGACIDSRGLCPVGWHVPLSSEWAILYSNISPNDWIPDFNVASYSNADGPEPGDDITSLWNGQVMHALSSSFSFDCDSSDFNSSGFSALAGGLIARSNLDIPPYGYVGTYQGLGNTVSWFTATRPYFDDYSFNTSNQGKICIEYSPCNNYGGFFRVELTDYTTYYDTSTSVARSVRCIKDE